jgi:tetratricopeptide (TPR) repeat protein
MPTQAELLELGMSHHRAGRLDLAEQAYAQLRRENPDHPDALHLLGVIAHQRGDARRAITLINQAILVRPGVAAMHANLAEACRAAGDARGAVQQCRRALEIDPRFQQARTNLGLALMATGQIEEAVGAFKDALAENPRDALTHNNLANALRLLNREDEALAAFRKAVELEPASAEFQSNLGQFLLELGRVDEAEHHCRNAVRLAPGLASAHSNLGNVLREQRKLDLAIAEYNESLRLRPDVAIVHNNMGQALQEMGGRLAEAVKWYEQSIKLDPQSARAICNLASALDEDEQHQKARELYAHALGIDPRWPEALVGLGGHLRDEGDLEGARKHFEQALAIKPRFTVACAALAGIFNEQGQFEEAQRISRHALEADPYSVHALGALSASCKDKLPDADVQLAQRMLDSGKYLTEGARSTLHYTLGAACDARKQYEKAAKHLELANALCKSGWIRYRGGYLPAEHEKFVDELVRVFDAAHFERVARYGSDSTLPVFVLGLPRSGTTLLEQILASHPQVHGAGELKLMREAFESVPSLTGAGGSGVDGIGRLGAESIRALAQSHLSKLAALGPGKARVVDKMPDNYLYLGLIFTMYPKARVIHSRRDLRDTAFSSWQTHFSQLRWACDQDWIAHRYAQYVRVMEHWRKVLPGRFIEVDYEETVADLQSVARRIIAHTGLEWDERCLAFHETRRPVRTASLAQVRQPIYTKSMGRWVNYEPWLGSWFERLAALMPPQASTK